MTRTLTRRTLLAATGAATLAAPTVARAQASARLVIIGGGFGGATAARYARINHPTLDVTLIEPRTSFITCPYGNLVLAGTRQVGQITHSYDGLRKHGVKIIHDMAAGIDAGARQVRLLGGETVAYDRLIVSPGIAIRWGALEGYTEEAARTIPHAWIQGDGSQLLMLRRQLESMEDGGVVGFSIPPNPFRCPPGPYERISMVASYLKKHKPKSKILALDAKEAFSKQGLFQDGWKALYGDMIEWVPSNKDGRVVRVDAAERTLVTEFGTRHKVAVANVIPPQYAASIARDAGLADQSGWVPVNPRTFEAKSAPGVYVIGDANNGAPMPKSGFVASNTAKHAVACAVASLRSEPMPEGVYFNTCYSHVGDDYGISIVGVFRASDTAIAEVPSSGGVSPRGDLPDQRRLEAAYADGWYDSITKDMFS